MSKNRSDLKIMMYALVLARRGYKSVLANPPVGSIVTKENKIISTGYHGQKGILHAEAIALDIPKLPLTGAKIYVSLEPCSHYGKTPPCVNAILDAGIDEVVYGRADITKEAGGGAEVLRSKGIKVTNLNLDICTKLLFPWESSKIAGLKVIDFWGVVTINGYYLVDIDLDPEDEGLSHVFNKFRYWIGEKVQQPISNALELTESQNYHFMAEMKYFHEFLDVNCIKRFNFLRLPLAVGHECPKWGKIKLEKGIRLNKVSRFGIGTLEQYS